MKALMLKETGVLQKGDIVEIEIITGDSEFRAFAKTKHEDEWPLYESEYKLLPQKDYPEEYL